LVPPFVRGGAAMGYERRNRDTGRSRLVLARLVSLPLEV
jgi:hypothetical protein